MYFVILFAYPLSNTNNTIILSCSIFIIKVCRQTDLLVKSNRESSKAILEFGLSIGGLGQCEKGVLGDSLNQVQ